MLTQGLRSSSEPAVQGNHGQARVLPQGCWWESPGDFSEVEIFRCTILGACQPSLEGRWTLLTSAQMMILGITLCKLAAAKLVLGFGDGDTGGAT